MSKIKNRAEALSLIQKLPAGTREAIAMVIETAETQGDYTGMDADGGSYWQSDVNETLSWLATEIRSL